MISSSGQHGGERKPVDLIINDQLEPASLPPRSLTIESQVNVTKKPWLGQGKLELGPFILEFCFLALENFGKQEDCAGINAKKY